ncbi:MAG TPA: zinc ABC transporter solute-binding protein [Tissierellia bacterium]|nr:zinc ABC transporter solute-binding protein [Tissierellia bacterium]
MKKLIIIIAILAIVFTGCAKNENASMDNKGKPLVYASFYPLYFLAHEIGGDNIELKTIIPHGVEPHDYEPSINQLKDLSEARVLIYNGANFESWIDKIVGSVVDEEIAINASQYCNLIVEDGVTDPHLWLDPENMIRIGKVIKDRFIELDPNNKESYEENYETLKNRLELLDKRYYEELRDKKMDTIIVSHNAFGYMAKRYGFKQIPVAGISPDQEPSPRTIADIIDLAKDKNYEYIFLESMASPKTVETIAEETNLKTLVLNPIEGLTEEEMERGKDYISIMEENLENLKEALVK